MSFVELSGPRELNAFVALSQLSLIVVDVAKHSSNARIAQRYFALCSVSTVENEP